MSPNQLYQYSILSALMHGLAAKETGISIADLLAHGDHGLGTVASMNGEVIVVEGEMFHYPVSGAAPRRITADDVEGETLPFAMVTFFQPSMTRYLSSLSMSTLDTSLAPLLPDRQNSFLAIKATAFFNHVTVRSIPAQSYPHEPLSVLSKRQTEHTAECIAGTLFGFWSPEYSMGMSLPRSHMHFISADKQAGGHVVDFETETTDNKVKLEAAVMDEYTVRVPSTAEFHQESLSSGNPTELMAAEGAE
ncbi:alpha-acetolactate decarboxylase [Aspergillus sclerotioniger CBS 115572]|uniref:Alpha-acetolactate decarboxylase n=1 Tax=Aspergillus sclerotioniger CBS 115572 TaxID=1450535 RepID=A0A317WZA7_9EURO|nr:alpha-acetolactate decarboxylase [Aspergillus sclerotioniger CBS 115572]PWY91311.1 alpha-acetolactate decarboxylase [Aspergillus sclerotioniger CBS 115572]